MVISCKLFVGINMVSISCDKCYFIGIIFLCIKCCEFCNSGCFINICRVN